MAGIGRVSKLLPKRSIVMEKTIDEAQAEKKNMECQIAKMLQQYSNEYHVKVMDIDLKIFSGFKISSVYDVTLDVQL